MPRNRWEKELVRHRVKRGGVRCWHCYAVYLPSGPGRYCSDFCQKHGRAICQWDDCEERIEVVRGSPSYYCGREHRRLAENENVALHRIGLTTWAEQVVAVWGAEAMRRMEERLSTLPR